MTYKEFSSWSTSDSKFQKIIIGFVIVYVAVCISWAYTSRLQAQKEIEARKVAQRKAEIINLIDRFSAEKKLLEDSLQAVAKLDIGDKDVNQAQADILALVTRNNIKLSGLNRNGSTANDITFDITTQGQWFQVLQFLQDVENSKYFIKTETLGIASGNDFDAKLTMRYKIILTDNKE